MLLVIVNIINSIILFKYFSYILNIIRGQFIIKLMKDKLVIIILILIDIIRTTAIIAIKFIVVIIAIMNTIINHIIHIRHINNNLDQ